MKKPKITICQNENCKYSKDVYLNGKIIGTVMANNEMTPLECYESLKNNWTIDELECQIDLQNT
jgi:hypothetical protein